MRWFKHMASSWDDEKLASFVEETGLEGYGFWWRLLEVISAQIIDRDDKPSVTYPLKKWARIFGTYSNKFQKILKSAANHSICFVKDSEIGIEVSVPNLLKYRDEWTLRKAKTPEQLPSDSRATPEQDTDTEAEQDIRTEGKKDLPSTPRQGEDDMPKGSNNGTPPCPIQEILNAYHEILPELPAVKVLTDKRKTWLQTRWREEKKRQSVEWWRKYWQHVRKQPHLMGQNDRGWKADFEWLVNSTNFAKVYEGKYLPKVKQPRLGL